MKKLFLNFILAIFSISSFLANNAIDSKLTNMNDDGINYVHIFENKFYVEDKNGNIKYITKEDIKKMWEIETNSKGLNVSLDNFEILKTVDKNQNKYYFLKATSTNNSFQTGAFFKVTKHGLRLDDIKCSCTGCPNGCNLQTFGGHCSCSPCFGDSSAGCKKTEEQSFP